MGKEFQAEVIRSQNQFHLRNQKISYVIGLENGGFLSHLYFGPRLETFDPAPLRQRFFADPGKSFSPQEYGLNRLCQEYPSYGLGDMREGALCVRSWDGTCSTDLRYSSFEILEEKPKLAGLPSTFGGESRTLKMILRDEHLGLEAQLFWTIFADCDVIARSLVLQNTGNRDLQLERVYSLCLDLPDSNYHLITLSGNETREREMYRRPLVPGEQSVSTLCGQSSHQAAPFMALVRPETNEATGEAIGMTLVYSGNHWTGVRVGSLEMARCMLGINDQGFGWKLGPGESFTAPEAVMAYSREGLGGMSAAFHQLVSRHLWRSAYAASPRPILINNWEATYFHFDQEKLLSLARKAASAGIELFVLDDGWFGHRDDATSSLGDWYVDRKKLPEGLSPFIDQVHGLGLRFGLWVEPEMVSPDSDLYRAHPDWCLHIEGREPILGRHQLPLDLSRQDVCDYLVATIGSLLDQYEIDYMKWDLNRYFTNIGSAMLPPDRQRELPHRYMLGLYGILEKLTQNHPKVLFESCASGGGRFDYGMFYYMPQAWTSDNTDALSRCRIQYATSLFYPQAAMGSHVSAVPNHQTGRTTPLDTRAAVAMGGAFGYELDLTRLPEEEMEQIRQVNDYVKQYRMTLQYGKLYRLLSPFEGNETAWMVISQDGSQGIFTFVRHQAASAYHCVYPLVALRGLEADAHYLIRETGECYTGAQLMYSGLSFSLKRGDAASVQRTLIRQG